jgi:hypothetical protein
LKVSALELSPPQFKDLYNALHDDFTPDSLKRMLLEHANRRLDDIVSSASPYPEIVEEVLKRAELDRWTWDLIRAAIAANPGSQKLDEFIRKYPFYSPAKPPPAIDPYRTPFVLAKQVLIDREELRAALEELQKSDGPRVLVVTGERASGKTYSCELVYYLANDFNPAHVAVYVDLDKDVREPDALAETIVRQMGREVGKIPDRERDQKMRYALRLCDWITTHVRSAGPATYWLVFDGFRERIVLTETKELIEDLAVRAQTTLRQCRIVLLNYTDILPPQIKNAAGKEHIKRIERTELVQFFEQVNEMHANKYTSLELEGKVDVIIQEVEDAIAAFPEGQNLRLQLINEAVSQTVRKLFK